MPNLEGERNRNRPTTMPTAKVGAAMAETYRALFAFFHVRRRVMFSFIFPSAGAFSDLSQSINRNPAILPPRQLRRRFVFDTFDL